MKTHLKYYEIWVMLVIIFCIFLLGDAIGYNRIIVSQLYGLRSTVYASFSQKMGTLLGIVITGLAILLTMEKSEPMRLLKKSVHYKELFDIFISGCKRLATGTLLSLIALVIDSDLAPKLWLSYCVLWCVIITAIGLFRCMWVLKNVVRLQIK